jgi:hypothetical protein
MPTSSIYFEQTDDYVSFTFDNSNDTYATVVPHDGAVIYRAERIYPHWGRLPVNLNYFQAVTQAVSEGTKKVIIPKIYTDNVVELAVINACKHISFTFGRPSE